MTNTLPRIQMAPDLSFSRLAWGAWRLRDSADISGTDDIVRIINASLDLGITTFDHADIYGNYGCEAAFGDALARHPELRDRMEIVTKCDIALVCDAHPEHRIGHYNTTRTHIEKSVEQSLSNLKTDHIDTLLLHRPDPLMIADEVAATFNDLQRAGKVLHFGVSNFAPSQFRLLQSRLDQPLVTNQIECSVLHLDPIFDGTFDLMQELRVHPMVWSPLGGAKLFTDKDDPVAAHLRPVLEEMKVKYGLPGIAEVAIAWLLQLPCAAIPVLGTMKPSRLADAVTACDVTWDRQDWFTVLVAAQGHPVP